jgi:hypothetical protein
MDNSIGKYSTNSYMKYLLIILSFAFGSNFIQAQPDKIFSEKDLNILQQYEDTLGLMAHLIVNDSLKENRFAATKKMIKTLVSALKVKNSYHYPFEQIKTISIQYPADSTFRIFTWQLYVNKDEYRYYGSIQMNEEDLKLFPLIDRSNDMQNIEYQELSHDNWYGALYYNLKEFDTPQGKKYLLLGYDAYSFYERRKLIDVVSFDTGKPVFGAPVIAIPNAQGTMERQSRFTLTYSAEASIGCNYDEAENKIVYNHLTKGSSPYEGKPTMVPSGSYDGFELKDGVWVYEEELFHFITPEGEYPRPEPVLDSKPGGKRKNIFGHE